MKAKDNEIHTQSRADCYICGSRGESLYENLKDRLFGVAGVWNLKQCPAPDCGLVWLDPMPIEQDIGKLYKTYYTHIQGLFPQCGNATAFQKNFGKAVLASAFGYKDQSPGRWTALLAYLGMQSRFIRERVGSTVSWLDGSGRGCLIDIGCGNGEFLAWMRDLGWDVVGVEPDSNASQVGREKYALKIYSGVLEEIGFPPETFDAVTMIHVIEHLADPIRTLKAANSLLKKGGRLAIHTPNICSLGHRWFRHDWCQLDPPRHLSLFTPLALLKIVEMAGLNVLDLKHNSVSADFVWMVSSACKQGLSPNGTSDGYVRISRYLFMVLEHMMTGWPFYHAWGENLVLIATKP